MRPARRTSPGCPEGLIQGRTPEAFATALTPGSAPAPAALPWGKAITAESLDRRWGLLGMPPQRAILLDPTTREEAGCYSKNIENFIGTVRIPVGLAGPLRVNGLNAHGDFHLPLATTEAALVASFSRGASLITAAGGCTCLVVAEGVTRSPGFAFRTLAEAGRFLAWALGEEEALRRVADATSRHGKMESLRFMVEGNHVYLLFGFTTGDAAGQNMVTIATQAICEYLVANTPVQPAFWTVEANASGDKKSSPLSFTTVRGKKVVAEVYLPGELVQRRLHATPSRLADCWRMSAIGAVLSGNLGIQAHFANGLAALFIACGQDAACVAEAAVGITRFELTGDGGLYASVTLPNLIVGTVGGGTGLPSQRACLELLGLSGEGKAQAFAEVCAGLVLAGELSICGAMVNGEFTHAHQGLARGRTKP